MLFSNVSQILFSAAESYLALSYSVIPLYGDADPTRPKVPTIAWSAYQKIRPSLDQCRSWFLDAEFSGIGIITGSISRLAVLDFDSPEAFRRFQSHFPDLAAQQVIQTRRGYHIYYQLPPNFRLPSRKGQGIDLLAEGCFAVARPTVIAGVAYQLVRGGMPRLLSLSDIHAIGRFMDEWGRELSVASCQLSVKDGQSVFRSTSGYEPETSPETQSSVSSPQSFIPLYRRLVQRSSGRNQALFQVALAARDHGVSFEEAIKLLVKAHIDQSASPGHTPECPQSRYVEAVRTIRSAYSRPARPVKMKIVYSGGLPNAAREKLFRFKLTNVVRLWEGLYLKGVQPGSSFSVEQALSLLKGVMGRDAIYRTVQVVLPSGEAVFSLASPSGLPEKPAVDQQRGSPNKCIFGRAEKSGIIRRGRKTRLFVMPTIDDLCSKLKVEISYSDNLTLEDLSSGKNTRQAVHREFIKRRPGVYPRAWLAKRLGVRVETVDSYNRTIPIHFRHQYQEIVISWDRLHLVPDVPEMAGVFLEDENRKRYPARRALAARLLGQGKSVTYKRQDANYYWYGETPPDIGVLIGLHAKREEVEVRMEQIRQFTAAYEREAGRLTKPASQPRLIPQTEGETEKSRAVIDTRSASQNERLPSGRRRLKDTNLENLAARVAERVNRLRDDPVLHLSMVTARRLVSQYQADLIEKSLRLVEKRRNIARPAGFLITVLRSEAKRGL